MKTKVRYTELAKYYDLIYDWKDYRKEAEKLTQVILRNKKSKGKELLEVACGTGKYLEFQKKKFSCEGCDLSLDMVKVAKSKVKGVKFFQADMITLNLKKKYDVITCMFSSIGYVKTYTNLKKTIGNFYRHLNEGGVVVIEPWFTKETFKPGRPTMTTYDGKDIKIARTTVSKVKGIVSVMDMHYQIGEKNKEVFHFVDNHQLGMFEHEKIISIMEKAGFKVKYLKRGITGRSLFIGMK